MAANDDLFDDENVESDESEGFLKEESEEPVAAKRRGKKLFINIIGRKMKKNK